MVVKLKRGKASRKEIEIIAMSDLSSEGLAKQLNRSLDFVDKYRVSEPVRERIADNEGWVIRLHASSFWIQHKKQLVSSEGEVTYFEQSWASYMEQFGSASDILATDELMIRDLITLDIMTNRAIVEQASLIRVIDNTQGLIDSEMKKEDEHRDQLALANWRTSLNSYQAFKTTIAKTHLDLQSRKDAKLRDLKGSRDQRFKQIEESRRNIFELIKELDSHNKRVQEGRLAQKVKLAADAVEKDWNQVMKFEDGEMDKPFLSSRGELEDVERFQNGQE